jgi:YD repeat-containing protein
MVRRWFLGAPRVFRSWSWTSGIAMLVAFSFSMTVGTYPARASNETYTYDNAGRLVTVDDGNGRITTYTLDPAGNRTNVTTALGAGVLQFSSPNFSVSEAGPTATITVTRTNGTTGVVGVTYSTTITGSTATAGSDYTSTTGTLSWANGDAANKTFTIAISEDALVEGNETVNLALTAPTGGAGPGSQTSAVLTITDNDVPVPGTLQFSAATYSVTEAGPQATITITRINGSNGAASVNYATVSGGTATAGSDYTTTTGTKTWADGDSSSKTFNIPILEDTAIEGNETVNLQLSGVVGAQPGAQTTAALTITDNDVAAGTVSFVSSTASVNENGTSVTLLVRRSGGSGGVVSATYSTADVTATAGSDYTAVVNGTVSWANGDTADKSITILITNDSTYETPETFTVTLSGATVGATPSTTVTINNTTLAPQFSINDVTVNEAAGTATLTVTKTGASSIPHQVAWATSNGTAVAPGDYTTGGATLTFPAGGTSTQSVVVSIVNDTSYEGTTPETFTVVLSGPSGNATISDNTGVVTITDNETAPNFSISSTSVNETAATATLTVSLSAASAVSHQVTWAAASGTATVGADFSAAGGTLTFSPGVTSQNVTINLLDDSASEGTETFTVGLTAATGGAGIATTTGSVTIVDNEVAPTFSINNVTVNENAGVANLTVTRSGATGQANQVSFSTANGSATSPADFTGVTTAQVLSFAAGDTTKNIAITLTDDSVYEGPTESFSVVLSSPDSGSSIPAGQGTGTVTLTENDPVPQFSINSVSVNEGGTATLTVTKTNASALSHTVTYQSQFGSATAGADYHAVGPASLIFAPSDTTKTITVDAISDNVYEGTPNEFYNVVLMSADNNAQIQLGTGVVTIVETNNAPVISVTSVSAAENSGSMGFLMTLSGTTNQDIVVSYNTADISATDGSDYTGISSSHIFHAGETSSAISIPLTNDSVYEGNETFALNLTSATGGAIISTPQVTGTIIDSVSPPQFAVSAAQYNESAGATTVTITKTGATALTHQVHYTNAGGTATAGTDYAAFSGDIAFGPSETSKTFPLTITQDTAVEGNETILTQLSAPTNNASIASGNPWALTILDDDAALPAVTISDVIVNSGAAGGSTAEYTLTFNGDINSTVSNGTTVVDSGDWMSPKSGVGSLFEAFLEPGIGTSCPVGPAINTTTNLGSGITWRVSVSGTRGARNSCNFRLHIRDAATHTDRGIAMIALNAIGN